MSAYAVKADLIELSMPAGALQGVPDATITRQLTWSSRRVDAAARASASGGIDADNVPELVKGYVCDIAAWRILRGKGVRPSDEAYVAFKQAHDEALESLDRWAEGSLVVDDATPDTSEGAPEVFSDEPRGWSDVL